MTGDEKAFEEYRATIGKEGVELREKRVVRWWIVYYVALMFIWQRKFMTDYTTVVGSNIWRPRLYDFGKGARAAGDYATLRHEMVHVRDSRRWKVLWTPLYFFPQALALGAFGAFWTPWCWLFLLFILPWPAPFRVWAELRGYDETFRAIHNLKGRASPESRERQLDWMVEIFCGWGYWRMSWSQARIRAHFKILFAELDH